MNTLAANPNCPECDGTGAVFVDLPSVFDGSVLKNRRLPCERCYPEPSDLLFVHCRHRERYEQIQDSRDAAGAKAKLMAAGWTNVRQIDRHLFIGLCPATHSPR